MRHYQTILHPTNFCEPCQEALRLACALARAEGARLVILHVVAADRNELDVESYPGEMKDWLDRLPLPGLPAPPERIVEVGDDPASVILEVAHKRNCDLIVMGTRDLPGEASVAAEVVRSATCQVVTVHTPPAATADVEQPADEFGVIL